MNELFNKITDKLTARAVLPTKKIKLADNLTLSTKEFYLVCRLCDLFCAIADAAGNEMISPPNGGVFWDKAKPGMGPFELYRRRDKQEIEHLLLLFNAFRDFCALAYEFDDISPQPDYWIRRYQRLAHALPEPWRVAPQPRFGEIGWDINGHPINRWASVNQERITALVLSGITTYLEQQAYPRIFELGAGAGEMGYAICRALPSCTWYDCDLLGSLIYSAIHLSITLPQKRHYVYIGDLDLAGRFDNALILRSPLEASECQNAVVYIPHFLLKDFTDKLNLHLAYNTYSFGEMPEASVAHYAKLLSGFLKKEGVLFEQNGYFPDRAGDNAETVLLRYFSQYELCNQYDGRWFPNGPMRIWDNNKLAEKLRHLPTHNQIKQIKRSLKDRGDKVDIKYPNAQLWEKVYERFTPSQKVHELFPWNPQEN